MTRLLFDPELPPADPPPGAHPLWWRVAWRLHTDHRPDAAGRCALCLPAAGWPCAARRLAAAGLVEACRPEAGPGAHRRVPRPGPAPAGGVYRGGGQASP